MSPFLDNAGRPMTAADFYPQSFGRSEDTSSRSGQESSILMVSSPGDYSVETLEKVSGAFRASGISGWGMGALNGRDAEGNYNPAIAGMVFVYAIRPAGRNPDHDRFIMANFCRSIDNALAWGERNPDALARVVADIRQRQHERRIAPASRPLPPAIVLGRPQQGSFSVAEA